MKKTEEVEDITDNYSFKNRCTEEAEGAIYSFFNEMRHESHRHLTI